MLMGDWGICLQISRDQNENRWLFRGGISDALSKPPGYHFLLSEMEVACFCSQGVEGLAGADTKGVAVNSAKTH